MLIDASNFTNKQINKFVAKLNKFHEKGKSNKITSMMPDLLAWADKNEEFKNEILYILSIIAEEYTTDLPTEIFIQLEQYLTNEEPKIRLNASICYGYALVNQLSKVELEQPIKILPFINLITDKDDSVRENVFFFNSVF